MPSWLDGLLGALNRRAPLQPVEQAVKIIGLGHVVLTQGVGQTSGIANQRQHHFVDRR